MITDEINISALISFLISFQGTLLGLFLILSYRKNPSSTYLGIFLIAGAFDFINSSFHHLELLEGYPQLLFTPFRFYFLFGISFFMYAKSLIGPIDMRSILPYLLPAILEFVCFSVLFFLSPDLKLSIHESNYFIYLLISYLSLAILYNLYWFFRTNQLIVNYKKQVDQYYSHIKGEQLRWIQYVTIIAGLAIISSPYYFLVYEGHLYSSNISVILQLAYLIAVYWIAFTGIQQVQLWIPPPILAEISPLLKERKIVKELPLQDREKQRSFQYLVRFVERERPYSNTQLNLSDLAKALEWSPRKLSNLIKDFSGKNFNQFINNYRIEDAKKMLVDSRYEQYSILAIGEEAGFHSKATFYTFFKEATGLTPNQYKKKIYQEEE